MYIPLPEIKLKKKQIFCVCGQFNFKQDKNRFFVFFVVASKKKTQFSKTENSIKCLLTIIFSIDITSLSCCDTTTTK